MSPEQMAEIERHCEGTHPDPFVGTLQGDCRELLAENARLLAQASYIVACEWRDKHSAAEAEAAELRERYAALRNRAGELAAALKPFAEDAARRPWITNLSEKSGLDKFNIGGSGLTNADLRRAAEAYAAHAALLAEAK